MKDSIRLVVLILLPIIFGQEINSTSYRILILTSPVASQSHSIYLDGIAKQLASRGHKVTHRCVGLMESTVGVHNYVVNAYYPDELLYKALFKIHSIQNLIHFLFVDTTRLILEAINKTYNEPLIVDLVQEPLDPSTNKSKYDVVLLDIVMGHIYLPLVHRMGVPGIFVSSQVLLASDAWNLNVPYPYFLNFAGLHNHMSIFTRTINFIINSCFLSYFGSYIVGKIDQSTRIFLPNSPPLKKLVENVSFLMTVNPLSVHETIPNAPHTINLECVQCRPARSLSQELLEVIERSGEHGFIYFSMGSNVRPDWMPRDFMETVLHVLSHLPQTILWKGNLNGRNVSNFYIKEWFPQQDLLAHPKLRFVITNGGLGTIQEASYHGCPILGFPLGFEQRYNMKVVKENKIGEYLDWRTTAIDQLLQTVTRMLQTAVYKEAALRVSIRMKDLLDSPSAQAAHWTEYIVRHKGASFLKSDSRYLEWHQYFLLDVGVIVATLLAMTSMMGWWMLRLGYQSIIRYFRSTQ